MNEKNILQKNQEKLDVTQMRNNIYAFSLNNNMNGEVGETYVANKETLSSGDKSDPDVKMIGRYKGSFVDIDSYVDYRDSHDTIEQPPTTVFNTGDLSADKKSNGKIKNIGKIKRFFKN